MKALYDGQEFYYKKMLDLQEQLRKSEEERIRLEERFNLLVRDSRSRHQDCINRLRMRYVDYLEEQRQRDELKNRLLGKLDNIDHNLGLVTLKTERLNNLRKQYEAYLLRTYGNNNNINRRAAAGSSVTTVDSGLDTQHEPEIITSSTINSSVNKSFTPRVQVSSDTMTTRLQEIPINYAYGRKLPSFSWLAAEAIAKKSLVSSSLHLDKYPMVQGKKQDENNDYLSRDFTTKPSCSSHLSDPVYTAERNLEQYLDRIKQMHKDVDKSEMEHSGDEAEQNTSGDLLNVSLTEDNFDQSLEKEQTNTRLRFARQSLANPRVQIVDETTTKYPESISSFRERLKWSEYARKRDEPKITEESTKFSETISPVGERFELSSLRSPEPPKFVEETKKSPSFRDRLKRSDLASLQNKPESKAIVEPSKSPTLAMSFRERFKRASLQNQAVERSKEETTKIPTFSETLSSLKDRLKLSDSSREDSSPSFSESIGSLREKFNRTDFTSLRNHQSNIEPDSFEDAFAKLTMTKERTATQEVPIATTITEELPTPPPEKESSFSSSSSSEQENDGIEDDYDDTVDIETWQPDDVEPEQQQVKRKDDILDLPRRKLESIEEVEHTEDEDVEEEVEKLEEERVELDVEGKEESLVIEEVQQEEKKEDDVKIENVAEELEEPPQQEEKVEALSIAYETQEQIVDPNATQQYYEQDGTLEQQHQSNAEYYEQSDAQQYQYPEDPNQQYTYDPNAQYAGYEGQYTTYEQYQQYDPNQYDPNQYDPNQQYQYADPNQAYDYSQDYVADASENYDQQQQQESTEKKPIIDTTTIEPLVNSKENGDEVPKKKKDAIKAILDSDSESFIERNLSNTESDFDFN